MVELEPMLRKFLQFHQWLVQTNNKTVTLARKEYILNVLLVGAIYLTGIALAVNIYNQLIYLKVLQQTYNGANPLLLFAVLLCFLALFLITKKGFVNFSTSVFIFVLWFTAAYASLRWGTMLSQSLLMYALIIVLSGILLNAYKTFAIAIGTGLYLLLITQLHSMNIIQYDERWRNRTADISSVIVTFFTLLIIALVSWLYIRQIKRAEHALIKERDSLEKKVEERTKQLRLAQAEQMSQWYRFVEIGRMASEIFHDIRNPLTTASLSLEEIKTSSTPATTAWNSIQLITRFVEANQRQVQKQTTLETFSPADEISLALQALQAKARKRQVVLKSDLVDGTLYGNPLKFYQVVINLVSNAIDSYLDFPTKKQVVTITLKKRGNYLHLLISDKGSGIQLQDHPYVFDPLFTTKSTEHGTGLGLAVTKTAIEQDFNSTILFCSQPSKGTTFITYFPLNNTHAS